MTRSRQFLRLLQSSVPLAFTGEGESQTMSPITRDLCWNFHSYTDPTYTTLRARVCACADRTQGERTLAATRIRALTSLPFLPPRNRFSRFLPPRYTTSTQGLQTYSLRGCE